MYKLSAKEGQLVLNSETYCPMKTLNINLAITVESQQDGKLWSPEEVKEEENILHMDIMSDLSEIIRKHICKINLFYCHSNEARTS
jgi:hypothetical protein